MSSSIPESRSSEARAGRTYGDIVLASFRRNRMAVAAFVVVILLFLVAIYAPLLSNDRPYAFYGTMSGWYEWTYKQVSPGAMVELRQKPQRFRSERAAWENGQVTRADLLYRMLREEYRRLEDAFDRLEAHFKLDRATASRWEARTMTWNEIAGAMTAEERALLEPVRARVVQELPDLFAAEVRSRVAGGIDLNLRRLGMQLGPEYGAKTKELVAEVSSLATRDYLLAEGDARASFDRRLRELGERLESTFALGRVDLKPRWYLPVLDSLSGLDVFLMTAAAALLLVFGPVRWAVRRRRRGKPWRGVWRWAAISLVPCAAAGLLWGSLHRPMLEKLRFKRDFAAGTARAQRAFWPPHRWRADEMPETREDQNKPPSARYPLGTDSVARDLLCQVLWGSRISLAVGFLSTAIAVVIGVILGSVAGYFRGVTDIAISRLIEWFLCFPLLFVVLAARALLPPSIFFLMIVIGIFTWMGDARLVRGEFLRLANQDFVMAARAAGAGHLRIIFRHILPNGMAPILVASAFGVAAGILIESSLSFLGFGVRPPEVSWGSILSYSRVQPKYWWLIVAPGFLIWLTVTAYNLVGDGLRDAIDPRLKV